MADGDLFPNLSDLLANWDQLPSTGSLSSEEHGGVTDEQIEEYFRNRLSSNPQFQSGVGAPPPQPGEETGDQPSESAAAAGQQQGEDEPVTPPPVAPPLTEPPTEPPTEPLAEPPAEPESVEVGGRQIPISSLRDLASLIDADPELQNLITRRVQERQQPPPEQVPQTGLPPQVPPTLPPAPSAEDLEDPTIRALWSHIQNQASDLQRLNDGLSRHDSLIMARAQSENNAIVNRAVSSFQQEHQLTDEQIASLREAAAGSNVLESVTKGYNPETGKYDPSPPDRLTAVERALTVAYNNIQEFRDHEFNRRQEQARQDRSRKQKLAGVSGSSGSVPRTQPVPTDERGRREAMVREMGEMMAGNYVQGE